MDEETRAREEAFSKYMDGEFLDELWEGGPPIDGRMPDGTYWEYDDDLQATIEVAPDGKRYIVTYQKGKGLVRIKELGVNAA